MWIKIKIWTIYYKKLASIWMGPHFGSFFSPNFLSCLKKVGFLKFSNVPIRSPNWKKWAVDPTPRLGLQEVAHLSTSVAGSSAGEMSWTWRQGPKVKMCILGDRPKKQSLNSSRNVWHYDLKVYAMFVLNLQYWSWILWLNDCLVFLSLMRSQPPFWGAWEDGWQWRRCRLIRGGGAGG